jgi:tetratricopeptide (TPR) repeat protein
MLLVWWGLPAPAMAIGEQPEGDPAGEVYRLAHAASATDNVVLRAMRSQQALDMISETKHADQHLRLLESLIRISVVPYVLPEDTVESSWSGLPPDIQASAWQMRARSRLARGDNTGALSLLKRASGTPLARADSLLAQAHHGYWEGAEDEIDSLLVGVVGILPVERKAALRRIALACYHMASSRRERVLRQGILTCQEIGDGHAFTKALRGYFTLMLAARSSTVEERSLLSEEGNRLLEQASAADSMNPAITLLIVRSNLALTDRSRYSKEELEALLASIVAARGGPAWRWGDEFLVSPHETVAIALVELGMAYKMQGKAEEARECWEEVLKIGPGGRTEREARVQLKAMGG